MTDDGYTPEGVGFLSDPTQPEPQEIAWYHDLQSLD